MKRLLFILFAALSFVACFKPVTTERQTISADSMMLHRSNLNNSTFLGAIRSDFRGAIVLSRSVWSPRPPSLFEAKSQLASPHMYLVRGR